MEIKSFYARLKRRALSYACEERGQALVPLLLTMSFMLLLGIIVGNAFISSIQDSNLGTAGNASRTSVVSYFWTAISLAAIGIIVTAASAVMMIIKRGL